MKVILLSNKTITTHAFPPQTIASPVIGIDGGATGDGVERTRLARDEGANNGIFAKGEDFYINTEEKPHGGQYRIKKLLLNKRYLYVIISTVNIFLGDVYEAQ